MNPLIQVSIPMEWDGLMIKEILFNHYQFSRKSLSKVKNTKGIYLNGEPVYVTVRVHRGDLLQIYVPIETSEFIPPEPVDFEIVYEDQDIVVVNKPAGIVVHPTKSHPNRTLANGLVYYWKAKGERFRFRPVHRLDRDTSGLLVIAKNQYAHHKLALQLQDRTLKRTYRAIVHGYVAEDKGIIDAPIMKDPEHALRRIVVTDLHPETKPAITYYKVIERFSDATLIELQLATGRTHQIRVHMSYIGHPLVGDELYGGEIGENGMQRQALHAIELEFHHPTTEKSLHYHAPLPLDMQSFLFQHLA
ncbi:RluA family pseudouridine synthase [Tepidibacillus fermentans]|uniref:Pseudouridine synthase n=1 Tax=Tepidibacillus fermentans TaxID=1281767 RepID=A0A4R3KIT5_9BACI|nr:RluA family pseudouridine synthase [Tepidibacillus fermentans]TCS83495.1 23S rRNA pseudouridine1911/1915/1917 synthase [Tepidibacillus fermentans]